MSSSMNLAITIFGFVLSALFLMVICCRLLCSRSRQNGSPFDLFQIDSARSMVERSIHGLEPSVVTCFPTIKYNQHIFTSNEDNVCTICLSDYKEKEILRVLPKCGHAFHIACIDLWLRQHHTCPVCRISLQVFSEWRQSTGPYISLVAKSRFVPGALPDHLFEQPKNHRGVSHGVQTGVSKNTAVCIMVAGNVGSPEAGGSSSLILQETQGHAMNELDLGEKQKLLEHRVTVELDASSLREEPSCFSSAENISSVGSVPDGPKEDIGREDGVWHTNSASAGAQAGASTRAHTL